MSDLKKLKEKLLQRARESTGGTFWIPQNEGEYLFGKVVRERTVKIKVRGGEKEVTAIDIHCLDDDNIYTVLLTHKVLARLWDDNNVQIGDIVLILYKGAIKDSSGDVKYHLYGLAVERGEHEEGEEEVPEFYVAEAEETEEKPTTVIEETKPVSLSEVVETKKDDKMKNIAEFVLNMLEFYNELTKEEIKELLKTKGYEADVDELIRYLGDKVKQDGDKVVLAQ